MSKIYYDGHVYIKRGKNVYLSDTQNKSVRPKDFPDNYSIREYYIKSRVKKSNEVMDYIDNYIDKRGMKEASDIEVREYQSKHSLFKKKIFYNRLKDLYNANSFKRKIEVEEIKEIQQKELEIQDKLTIIMENIEYMLSRIKKIDMKMYNEYQIKYEKLLQSESNVLNLTPFDYKNFILLESDIELTLSALKRNTSNIMDYLNALKKEYLDNLLNKSLKKTDITIKDIDKMNELFLKSKDNYTILNQRMILKTFALVYFLELLENRELDVTTLENSYFKMHLKTILMYINTFVELDLIKNNMLIDLEDNLSLDSVLKIIDSIEINDNLEKGKVLELIK